MNNHLVVVQAFGPHAKGARISNPTEVAATLASEHAAHVVRIIAPDAAPAIILPNQEA